ncbi:hypothetical protein BATDEDRAFT_27734 [Batrachochytrium dendrobatidis JAM81]|uniref:LysM domain-containing protein n=1 Tax=Batrachochytrium dendrobatidis (strain JAM81 / FGSC 10211) TaxID=684364 RepID=F4PBS4_BATDJ|nr:uncharacterized protein BATDEDRAFT_27734 [Batrachochytrium dendrobatidis JAM81]EGF77375.1 hypothetical protein BATDEDRAFT_27734 [Batrachochytrium dendrobatidis JAM81]|eukprot:XP_006681949.1 hypothetical protein BATDEDRAFT_27734 [Batrachochytrium dendrobatidis JAM81]
MSATIRLTDFDMDFTDYPPTTYTHNFPKKSKCAFQQEPSPVYSDISLALPASDVRHLQQSECATDILPNTVNEIDHESDSSQDGDEIYDDFCEPVYIHWIRHGDTIANVAKVYQTTTWMLAKANEFEDERQPSLEGRRFLVIPSASTFQEPIWDVDQERHELCRNFLILIHDDDFCLAHRYLGKSNYNLPAAIENYYFDLC